MLDILSSVLVYPLLIVLLLGVIAAGVAVAARSRKSDRISEADWPYTRKPVLTPPERQFFERLLQAAPDHWVLAQVQVSAALASPQGPERMAWLNRIHQKSFDFLLCSLGEGMPLLAIELDDSSHLRARRRRADQIKNRACEAAGLPLVRYQARSIPSVDQLRSEIHDSLMARVPSPVSTSVAEPTTVG